MNNLRIEIHAEESIEKTLTFDVSKMDKIEKQQMLVEIAKMIGFSRASPAYWDSDGESLHELEEATCCANRHNAEKVHLGLLANASVEIIKADDESDEVYIFDTEEQAKQFVEKLTFNKDEK